MSDFNPLKILLVDDEKNIRHTLYLTLSSWGHEVTQASSGEEAMRCVKLKNYDLLLTDFKMHGASGVDLVRFLKTLSVQPVSVVMTAYASFDNAVSAVKEGAFDYLPKPFSNNQLKVLLGKVEQLVQLKREVEKLRSGTLRSDYFVGQTSEASIRLEEFVRKIASTDAPVLLVGESGTGKTELAKLIHFQSPRSTRPFVVVNCATLSESLLESELFGHAKGAFTGAVHDHMGKLEAAHQGTVLIDEVGDLSLKGQTKLLRFLQEKVIERVGSNKAIQVNSRVIAATNRNLEEAIKEGKFREDLYFRLNMFEFPLVSLRHRKEDIPVLVNRFFNEFLCTYSVSVDQKRESKLIPNFVIQLLMNYSWPGNVRELRNTIERVVLLAQGREIQLADLPESVLKNAWKIQESSNSVFRTLEEIEKDQIEKVLRFEASQEKAADLLGITTVTLWRKRKQYGLP